MTAVAAVARPDPLDVFRERAEARAYLVEIGDLSLHDAVDGLQANADVSAFYTNDFVPKK